MHEAFDALHALGVTALRVPASHGGGEADLPTLVRVLERVGAADPSVGLVLVWQYVFHADLSLADNRWPAAVRERVLRSAVAEGALINALRVEPQLGTPARGGLPDTVGRETADGWELRGHKTYCTGIPALRWLLVWAAPTRRSRASASSSCRRRPMATASSRRGTTSGCAPRAATT